MRRETAGVKVLPASVCLLVFTQKNGRSVLECECMVKPWSILVYVYLFISHYETDQAFICGFARCRSCGSFSLRRHTDLVDPDLKIAVAEARVLAAVILQETEHETDGPDASRV